MCFRSLAGSLRRCPVPGGSLSLLPGFVHCPEKRSPASAGCLTGPRGPWSPTQIARAKMAPGSRCFALMLFSVVVDFASLGKLRVFRRNRALIWSADLLRGCVFRRSLVMRGGGGRGGGAAPRQQAARQGSAAACVASSCWLRCVMFSHPFVFTKHSSGEKRGEVMAPGTSLRAIGSRGLA